MPLQKEAIDYLVKINDEIVKSKITSVYFSLPTNCIDTSGFEQTRMILPYGNTFEEWKPLIKYTLSKGFDFIYLLNSPHSFYTDDLTKLDFKIKKLHNLLLKLQDIGVKRLRVGNTQVINYLRNHYPEFKIHASTSLEYNEMKQYDNFFTEFPEVKNIVPSWNINRNFKLLKNLKEKYPDVVFEIMVDASCIAGCPFRHCHDLANSHYGEIRNNIHIDFAQRIFTKMCNSVVSKNVFNQICKTNVIYPWEIKEYEKLGFSSFKLTGRGSPKFLKGEYGIIHKLYLKGVDNFKNIEKEDFRFLNLHCISDEVKAGEIGEWRKHLPDIKHFRKNGHLCSSRCGVECKYCEKSTKKLEERFGKKLGILKQ